MKLTVVGRELFDQRSFLVGPMRVTHTPAQPLQAQIERSEWTRLRSELAQATSGPLHERAKQPMTGIGSDRSVRYFAGSVLALGNSWARLSPRERADTLLRAAGAELLREGVPAPTRVDIGGKAERAGMMPGWFFVVSPQLLEPRTIDEPTLLRLGATMFHEARHAEQLFRVARLMTTRGAAPAEVSRALGIPLGVAEQAVKQPLPRGGELWNEAVAWMRAFVTDGDTNRATTRQVVATVTALEGARASAQAAVGSGVGQAEAKALLEAAIGATEVVYTAYRNIPYEQDAKVAEIRCAHAVRAALGYR
jgi:hypothetical protein